MAAFPGDPTILIRRVRSIDRGDPYNLSALFLGSHAGTHIDPPSHFIPGGFGTDRVDLSLLNGPCTVVDVPAGVEEVRPEHVERIPASTERVLFHTANSERWESTGAFFPDYAALGPDAARALIARGVRLVGIDALSIERDTTGTFPVHHILLERGALVLEGLRLAGIHEGTFELRCLPLRIVGGDGGPCRAVLIEG